MYQSESLYRNLQAAGDMASYDEHVKQILSEKRVLAHILTGAVPEFEDMEPDDVVPLIDTPAVSGIPLDPGMTGSMIIGNNTENTIAGEGTVTFDVFSSVLAPTRLIGTYQKMYVDVEAQKDPSPGYRIVYRGSYYDSRMISFQKDRDFTGSDYDSLKKVCSIWLILDAPKRLANTISQYELEGSAIYGQSAGIEKCDLMRIIVIGLPGKCPAESETPPLLRLLWTLFTTELTFEKKREILETEFGISMKPRIEKEMKEMCNWSEAILQRGVSLGTERGIEIGTERGIEIGANRTKLETAKALIGLLPIEVIAEKIGLSPETVSGLK